MCFNAIAMNNPLKPTKSPVENLLRWLIPILVFFLVTRTPDDADMWWHLSAGKAMLAQGRILTSDVFSFTRFGAPWTNAFWLADIGMYGLYRLGGFFALTLLAAGLITATMLVIMRRSKGSILLTMGIILLGAFGMSPFDGVRPQLLSFLLLAVLDAELARYKSTQKLRPWFIILIFILWANIHGGFIWGFLLLAAYIGGDVLNRVTNKDNSSPWKAIGKLGLWTFLAGLATLINPNGLALWKLPFYTVQVSLQNINEWASPDFHRPDLHPMLWLIFLFIIGLGFAKKIPDWGELLKFIGFAYLAFVSQRSIAPFLIVAIPVVSDSLWQAWTDRLHETVIPPSLANKPNQPSTLSPKLTRAINIGLISLCALMALGRVYWLSNPDLVYAEMPTQAVQWVNDHQPAGPMLNSYNWGGYLIWSLPAYPVFIDGRADLYGDQMLNDWWTVVNGSDQGLALLDKWKIKLVFLETDWPVVKQLPALGWQLLYKDSKTVILGR